MGAVALFSGVCPSGSIAQEVGSGVREAYFRAVGKYFEVPLQEVKILAIGDSHPMRSLSPSSWLGTPGCHLTHSSAFDGAVEAGSMLRSVFGWGPGISHFSARGRVFGLADPGVRSVQEPSGRGVGWDPLEDPEVIALVNVRVLSEQVGVPPIRVIRSQEEAGSFTAGYALLRGR